MKISLIIPCYNEEVNIQKGVLDKIGNYVLGHELINEVVIVDDGSSDGSAEIVENEYLPKFSKFKLERKKHQGKALAVIHGIQKSNSEYVIFTDIDLATPLEETEKIIKKFQEGFSIVIGSRATNREGAPINRRLQSAGFIFIRDMIIGLDGIVDTQCGFKGFKRSVALEIVKALRVFSPSRQVAGSSVSAGFDLEFLFIAQQKGLKIVEVPVRWRHAETKNVHFISDSFETIKDIISIRMYAMKGAYPNK